MTKTGFCLPLFVCNVKPASSVTPHEKSPETPLAKAKKRIKLNLIIQGLFIGVVEDPASLDLWVPYFHDHVYEWESSGCEGGPFPLSGDMVDHLQGLIGGKLTSVEDLQPSTNTTLQDAHLVERDMHCKISLPFPQKIWSLRRIPRGDEPFYEPSTDVDRFMVRQPESVATAHVFEYELESSALHFHGKELLPDPETGTLNLHLWVDDIQEQHIADPLTPVEQVLKHIAGTEIRQSIEYWGQPTALDPQEQMPEGVPASELYTRYEREHLDTPVTA